MKSVIGIVAIIIGAVILVVAYSSLFAVRQTEQALVLRFAIRGASSPSPASTSKCRSSTPW